MEHNALKLNMKEYFEVYTTEINNKVQWRGTVFGENSIIFDETKLQLNEGGGASSLLMPGSCLLEKLNTYWNLCLEY